MGEGQTVLLQVCTVEECGVAANHPQVIPQGLCGGKKSVRGNDIS